LDFDMSKTALIDGDPIVYVCGFAAEESWYETEDGMIHPTQGKAKEHCVTHGQDPSKISVLVEAEPKQNALHLVKNLLLRVKDHTGCSKMRVFLSGNGSSFGPQFTYLWTTNNGNITSGETTLNPTVNTSGTYTLRVTNNINGCTIFIFTQRTS